MSTARSATYFEVSRGVPQGSVLEPAELSDQQLTEETPFGPASRARRQGQLFKVSFPFLLFLGTGELDTKSYYS